MINLLRHSWKTVFYPVAVIFIIMFDQFMGFSVYVTIFKILMFSILHAFVVKRTKYIYDSVIYHYYATLRKEYEANFTFEPLVTESTRQIGFLVIYTLILFLSIFRYNDFSGKHQIGLLLCMIGTIFIVDVIYELIRIATNKTDFSKIQMPISSFSKSGSIYTCQRRTMYTMIVQKFVKYGPACIHVTKAISAGVGIVEFGHPTVFAPGKLGPLTKFTANEILYKNEGLQCPIVTTQDMIYECNRQLIEEGVANGSRQSNYMPKRTFSFVSEMERNQFLEENKVIK